MMSIAVGDELAMNTMLLTVVDIDGNGNGSGLIKIPMMNNINVSVILTGIKAAEGGCITAGSADLGGVALSDSLRARLDRMYTLINKALNVAEEHADVVAKVYNSVADQLAAIREKANILISKIDNKIKPDSKEIKELQSLAETTIAAKQKELELLKINGQNPEYIASLGSWLNEQNEGLACLKTIEVAPTNPPPPPETKKGPAQYDDEFFLEPCKLAGLKVLPPSKAGKNDKLDPHYVENINKGQQVYSCNCGWIDLNHAFTETRRKDAVALGLGAKNLWMQILEEKGEKSMRNNGFKVKYSQDVLKAGISIGIHREYFVNFGLNINIKKQIAMAIFQEVSIAYESLQSLQPFGTSSFEPSDLVSNLLGFYFFIENGFTKDKIFKLCDIKSVEESMNIYKLYPNTFNDEKYKNKNFKPRFFPNTFCSNSQFPKEFQTLKPALKKNNIFRDWNFTDYSLIIEK